MGCLTQQTVKPGKTRPEIAEAMRSRTSRGSGSLLSHSTDSSLPQQRLRACPKAKGKKSDMDPSRKVRALGISFQEDA